MAHSFSTSDNQSLEQFTAGVLAKEPTVRLECFSGLEKYLLDETTSVDDGDVTEIIHGLFKWIEGSNFRVRT